MSLTQEERNIIIDYRIEKSMKALQEAKDTCAMGHYSLAIQRLYYAAYYVASALLISRSVKVQTHAGVKAMLGKEFVLTGILPKEMGKTYSNLLQMRHTGDYDDSFDYTKEDVEKYLPLTVALVDKIVSLLKDA